MSLVNIISAVGNNNTVYPLLVRDCGIENPIKVALTYKQNVDDSPKVARYAVRERILDEYLTSATWLGGIPFVEFVADKFVKGKGFNPLVNPRLFKEDTAKTPFQGINYNINKFKNIDSQPVKAAVADLVFVKENQRAFEKVMSKRFIAAVAIPLTLMGFVIPKCIFALSKNIFEKEKRQILMEENKTRKFSQNVDIFEKPDMTTFGQKKKQVSFEGSLASAVANLTTPDKMATIDGGYAIGRILTARKGYEPIDIAIKMAGMLYLNFKAPKQIEKLFDFSSDRFFNCNVKLDPKLLADKRFLVSVKNNKFAFLKGLDGRQMLDYIDKNPDSQFAKSAAKLKKISMLTEKYRDPRVFVDISELENFGKNILTYSEKAIESGNVKAYAKKALKVKSANILSNVALSSFLLAYVLPKIQFGLRELFTGSKLEPGLVNVDEKLTSV